MTRPTAKAWLARLCLALAGLAQAAPALADAEPVQVPRCTAQLESEDGIVEPAMCPAQLPRLLAVRVDPPAVATDHPQAEPDCATFRPRAEDVQGFLARAGVVSQHDWLHHLDWTACQASGTARLADGRDARWRLLPSRMGSIRIGDDPTIYLYCPGCGFKPFW